MCTGICSDRIGWVEQHSAHPADLLFVESVLLALETHGWCAVDAADLLSLALDPNVTVLAVRFAPRVSDQPIRPVFRIRSVTHELNSVIDIDVLIVVTAVKDTALVKVEVGGIHGDAEGSNIGQMIHRTEQVIVRQGLVASDEGQSLHVGRIQRASCNLPVARCVRNIFVPTEVLV